MGNITRLFIAILWCLCSTNIVASPTLPGEKCKVAPHPSWSEAEAWAWGEICEGRNADFGSRYGKYREPISPERWSDNTKNHRRLSQKFIEGMLLYEPWRSAIPRNGMYIDGAFFPDGLDLSYAQVGTRVWLVNSLFPKPFRFEDGLVDGDLVLLYSVFEAAVVVDGLQVNGTLNLSRAKFKEGLNMDRLRVDLDLILDNVGMEGDVSMIDANVSGSMKISRSILDGNLIMYGAHVGSYLLMRKGRFLGDVNLRGVEVGKNLETTDSFFKGQIELDDLLVGSYLIMNNSSFENSVGLQSGKLNGDLQLINSDLTELNLTGTSIAGILILGTSDDDLTRWKDGGVLILRNTHVASIQDKVTAEDDAWPTEIQFDGFVYDQLGGPLGIGSEADMMSREVSWYIEWMSRDLSYSPQPYQQLAIIFRKAGYPKKANSILYAGRERERRYATGASRVGLEMLKWTIGYGFGTRYFRALWWIAGFVGFGMFVLKISGEGKRNNMPYGLSFSLDHLLPIVTLRKYHFDVTLNGWPRYYFYFHKLMGYVLASFLIAGMAGLTQ